MRRSPILALVPLLLLLPALASAGDDTLSAEVLWKIERLGNPVVSADARWIVAPVTRFDVEKDSSTTVLHLFRSDGSVARPLTRSDGSASSPVFSPDGNTLAFVARREGDEAPQIYLLPLDGPGEARRLTEVPTGVSAPKWVGEHLYFISRVWPDKDWEGMKQALKARGESKMSARTWTRLPYSHWDTWIDEDRQAHVFRIPAAGGPVEAITQAVGRELPRSTQGSDSYDVSPDGRYIAFVSDSLGQGVDPELDLFLARIGSNEAENLTADNPAFDGVPQFSPDGRRLAFVSQAIKGFYGDTRRLQILELESRNRRAIARDWDRSADGLVWAPDGASLYGAIDDAGTRRIWQIPLEGSAPRPLTGATDFGGLAIAGDGTLVATNQSFMYPPRLVVVDTASGEARRIDSLNDALLAGVRLGRYESMTYTGANEAEIQMWINYPPDFDPRKRWPLLFLIHGGPHNGITDAFAFRWSAQTFASWGYVVTWHNFHGSSGFGQDFADAINPDWRTLPYEDTIRGAAWLAAQPWIDESRMVAAGASYGGYLASVLLGKEHPFNALVIHAPVYNMYSQMAADFAVHSTRFGSFWERPEIYREISPHYYAGEFSTPSLIIHGQLDYRVPVGQAFELFRTLQTRGVESRLIYYPDENHWILKPQNSIYWYQQVRAWVERHAAPGPR
jgi:dipeptidyl aminopeptidase/acylaminoacyl peptidase